KPKDSSSKSSSRRQEKGLNTTSRDSRRSFQWMSRHFCYTCWTELSKSGVVWRRSRLPIKQQMKAFQPSERLLCQTSSSRKEERKVGKKDVVKVTMEDVQKITLLAMKEDSPERDRDALLAILSFNVMLRASEAAEIKWAGVTQKDGMIEVHVKKAKNDQLRLGRSSFFNYEPGSDADILMCRWRLRTKGKCPYVFSHLDGSKKLSKQAISTLSTKMLAAIGKPGATHHCFRRGGANHMRRIGHSIGISLMFPQLKDVYSPRQRQMTRTAKSNNRVIFIVFLVVFLFY
ncbi:Protein CBG11924, partial [Caenorhabditis briggsae]